MPEQRGCDSADDMRPEAGAVAGLEALAFGVLVFVVGTLIVLNGWAVVDTTFAVEAAAREAARSIVEDPLAGPQGAELRAHRRAHGVMVGQSTVVDAIPSATDGELVGNLDLRRSCDALDGGATACGPGFGRGECVTVTYAVEVPLVRVPIIGASAGSTTVRATYRERVDPFRAGLDGSAGAQTACA